MHLFKQQSSSGRALTVICTLLVAVIIFWAGMAVGHRQAEYGYHWDKHYFEVFAGQNSPFSMHGMNMIYSSDTAELPNGASGRIVAVHLPTFAVSDPNNSEKVVIISSTTMIRRMHSAASTTDLRVGSIVTVIGTPDSEGRIAAAFVRLMPPMASTSSNR